MGLFSRPIPRKATAAAFLGFLYALFILLYAGDLLTAACWFLLSVSLLFARPFAYYVFLTWDVLWLAWRAVVTFQGRAGAWWAAAIDVLLPLASLALLSASGYLEAVRPQPAAES